MSTQKPEEQIQAGANDAGKFGLSPRASALRVATEELASELSVRRPELVARSDRESFGEALQHVTVAQHLLAIHAAAKLPG
ncbi:hypothetical protein F0U60_33105 [Archangium minus]|uniref:Uncharacterized protein n=1 Tax=Archangium minus TaxID=83450 RepID=A0ABY9WZ40_9BACT|nr:hypothetical protein F0U60_33105 [Archangium minus]